MTPSPMHPPTITRAFLASLLAVVPSACQASRVRAADEPLPFHVALVPTEVQDVSILTGDAARGAAPRAEDDMRLRLASADVSRVLCDELANVFVRATALEASADAVPPAALGQPAGDAFWQARARAAGADLLVRSRLVFDPAISGARNEKFWLNLPLFLLGGPMCYFVSDRSYAVSARLQVELFDTSLEHESLAPFALLALPLYAEFQGADLRFLDRADGAGDYVFSLLVPAGLLARDNAAIAAELGERVPLALGRELAAKVRAERAQLEQSPSLGAFRLDSRALRVERGADGRMHVRLPVFSLGQSEGPNRYEIRAGAAVLARGALAGDDAGPGRHEIDAELEVPADTDFLRVMVLDTSANARSYTLRLPPDPGTGRP